jgi:hypothetical protein
MYSDVTYKHMPSCYVDLTIFIVAISFVIKDLVQNANFEHSELIITLTVIPKSSFHWKLKDAVNMMTDICPSKKFVTVVYFLSPNLVKMAKN